MMAMRQARTSGRRANRSSQTRSSQTRRIARFEQLEPRVLLAGLPYGAVAEDTGEYMLGDIVATIVFFESDGSIDQNQEDWNPLVRDQEGDVILDDSGRTISASGPNLIEETKGRVIEGLEWWQDTLTNFYALNYDDVEQVHSLNFIYDFQYAHNPVATGYEPINRTSNEHAFWVGDFLNEAGYLETGFLETDIRTFNNAQREKYDADWAYTIFVANDYNDDDGRFAAGGRFSRAFAFSGGRYLVSPAGRPASTFAHESGHIFYARDEYSGSGARYTDHRGYYDSQNWNAYDNPAPGFVQQSSIMDSGADFVAAWAANVSSESSLAMIGWQDSDGDGVFDVLDVPLSLSGTGYFNPNLGLFRFQGRSEVQTLVNVNSSGRGNDITINEVSRLVYSLDSGLTWSLAQSYNAPEVEIDFTISLDEGQDIWLRTEAVDPITGQIVATSGELLQGGTALPAQVPLPGITGFVWDDRNVDGQWDQPERGVPGWRFQLVDSQGAAVETAQYLQPDDYANETLLNQVLAGVTLTAVGFDTKDSRVGAINTEVASAGNRVFGLVRSGPDDEWEIEWTSVSRALRVDFDSPTTYISIDAIGLAGGSRGRLEIYDAAGNLLGRTTTSAMRERESRSLALGVATPAISYAIIRAASESPILLDNLQVGPNAVATSGVFGSYALPYLAPGEYRVMAIPSDDWELSTPAGGIVDVTVDADGRMVWPEESDRPSDFAGIPDSDASAWNNLVLPVDVNDDWLLSPIDALQVIHDLNTYGGRALSAEVDAPPAPFIDVNGDSQLSPIDALIVITALNEAVQGGSQQDEAASTVTAWSNGVSIGGGEGEAVTGVTEHAKSGDTNNSLANDGNSVSLSAAPEWHNLAIVASQVPALSPRTLRLPPLKLDTDTSSASLFETLGGANGSFAGGLLRFSMAWSNRELTNDEIGSHADSQHPPAATPVVAKPTLGMEAEPIRFAAPQFDSPFDEVVSLIAADVQHDRLNQPLDLLAPSTLHDEAQDDPSTT